MFTKNYLDNLKNKSNIGNLQDDLVDISAIKIDTDKPVIDRIKTFLNEVKNPYLFKVGNVPVKISFAENAPTIQSSLENFINANL